MIILYMSVVFGCVYLGVMASKKLQERQSFFEDMRDFLSGYLTNISFLQNEFKMVVNDYVRFKPEADFSRFLLSYIEGVISPPDFLTAKEQSEVVTILKSLGKQDEESERKVVESSLNLIKVRVDMATIRTQKYSSFSVKLGLLVGVLLVILLL